MKKVCIRTMAAILGALAFTAGAIAVGTADAPELVKPNISQDANIYIPNTVEIKPGNTADASIYLDPGSEGYFENGYRGFQFDVTDLPAGVTITSASIPQQGWSTVEMSEIGDGACRLMVYVPDGGAPALVGNSPIMSLTFSAASQTAVGTYTVNINEVDFSSPKGVDIECRPSTFKIMVTETPEPPTPTVMELIVDPTSLELMVGDPDAQVTATVLPADAPQGVTWTSSNPAVATVDADGMVHAVAPGQTTVTATTVGVDADGNHLEGYCYVTVKETPEPTPVVMELIVDPASLELMVGDPDAQVTATVLPADAPQGVTWTSSNPAVATVDADGMVHAVAPGQATVTATTVGVDADGNHLEGYCYVTVKETPEPTPVVMQLIVDPTELEFTVGDDDVRVTATVLPAEAPQGVTWSSSDESIVTVDADGMVHAVAPGKATVTATTVGLDADGNHLEGYCYVTVLEKQPENPYNPDDIDATPMASVNGREYPNLYMIVESGTEVNMWVIPVNGNPDGWTYEWKLQGSGNVLGTSDRLVVAPVNNDDQPLVNVYTVTVKNSWNTELMFEEVFNYTVEVWRKGEFNPNPDDNHQGWYPGGNGTFVSEIKIREGNELGLYVYPMGGYQLDWTYLWTAPDNSYIGDNEEEWTRALLYPAFTNELGNQRAISDNIYRVEATNMGPEGTAWYQETLQTPQVKVYRRPQAPTQLLRKGQYPAGGQSDKTGTSCTFVVMMTPLDNQQILDLGYTYTYGYFDQNGVINVIETTDKRYTHTTPEIYNNSAYTFWAYSNWTYPDGSIVTSGLRYLDGGEDYDFDASVFAGTRSELSGETNGVEEIAADRAAEGIFSLDGRYLGNDASGLARGLYIINGKKVVVK